MMAFRATSPKEAATHLEKFVKKKNAFIKNLWIDSHGYYSNRQSTFYLGGQRINYITINDTAIYQPLMRIAALCHDNTNVVLGACFTAATYNFPDKNGLKGRRMNGDSLLLAMAHIFKHCNIYGCQSWVMENPGIWHSGYKLEGAPLFKMYKDELFKPAWLTLGQWTKYNPLTQQLQYCNAIAQNSKGDIFEKPKKFQSFKWVNKKIQKSLCQLKPNLYRKPLKVEL